VGSARAFWQDRASYEAAFRKSFLSLETTRNRHLGTSPHPERINPDTWTDEYYFLNHPGQADIQTDLFFDYQNNLKAYPIWQKWLRDHHLPCWSSGDVTIPRFWLQELKPIERTCPVLRCNSRCRAFRTG